MKWIVPKTFKNPIYPYKRSKDVDADFPIHHKVVIVGGGPTGLMAAIDLASRGLPSVLITKENTVVVGSRAICFSKKTLEVTNRLGVAKRLIEKGITWNVGKVFYRDEQIHEFNLLPEEGHKIPAFINLQQYYFEEYLVDEVYKKSLIDIRWEEELIAIDARENKVVIKIKTPEGIYQLSTAYLLACDGVQSPVRNMLGIPYKGEKFEENFLIADITMEKDFPKERWFWFDPPFNKGYSALLHKQPDGVWRIDLQLGRNVDKAKELDPERIKSRLKQMLGDQVQFELEWTSIYQFRCMRIDEFVHGRVIFAGDSAHLVSPFGARGANGGVQDIDNLIWKLAYVIQGKAPPSILNTYQEERSPATNENIYFSSTATDFISPKSEVSLIFRNSVLDLAKKYAFAQQLINSGRLSHPFRYLNSSLTLADEDSWQTEMMPGSAVKDVLLNKSGQKVFLIDELGNDFSLIIYHQKTELIASIIPELLNGNTIPIKIISIAKEGDALLDFKGQFAQRYDARNGNWYLIRPDHYIAARGRRIDDGRINRALNIALGRQSQTIRSQKEVLDSSYVKDDMYNALIKSHGGLDKEASDKLNAKLILLMMDKIGDKEVFLELLKQAKGDKEE